MDQNYKLLQQRGKIPLERKDVKVAIGVPSSDMLYADFAFSLQSAIITALSQGLKITAIFNKKGSMINQARCALVEDARKSGATHLLFIDSDHVVPNNLLVKLVEADKDIIGIHCVTKRTPIRSNCEDMKGNRLTKPGTGIEEVTRLGTGIMLIGLNVFDKLKQPIFEFKFDRGGFRGTPHWVGEDYNFCEAARHKGFKIFVDHDLSKECYHIGPTMFGVQELERTNGTENTNG